MGGVPVTVGTTGVFVGGTGVFVGGTGVFVTGTGVFVGVLVTDNGVSVGTGDASENNQSVKPNMRPPLVGDLVGIFSPQKWLAIQGI